MPTPGEERNVTPRKNLNLDRAIEEVVSEIVAWEERGPHYNEAQRQQFRVLESLGQPVPDESLVLKVLPGRFPKYDALVGNLAEAISEGSYKVDLHRCFGPLEGVRTLTAATEKYDSFVDIDRACGPVRGGGGAHLSSYTVTLRLNIFRDAMNLAETLKGSPADPLEGVQLR